MTAYCISYDLKVPGRDYTALFNAIKQSELWWHYLDSTWIISTNESAQQVWDRLANAIDKNDYLLVIEVRNNTKGWLPKEAWTWISSKVPSP